MGKFAFGRSFRMLENEEWHSAIRMLRNAMRLLGPLSSVPWLAQIGFAMLPRVSVIGDWCAMMDFCKDRMRERIEMHGGQFDLSYWLIDASIKAGSIEEDRHWLNGDAIASIIAGSDTVAPTLVYLFYEIAQRPSEVLKLLLELQSVNVSDHNELQALPHLNGFISETLRLHPPVPTGGYRQSPPGGIIIDGYFVPEGTTLVAPRYTIGRRELSKSKSVSRKLMSSFRKGGIADLKWSKTDALSSLSPKVSLALVSHLNRMDVQIDLIRQGATAA
ncbi:MAG: hypothetical protein Q9161_009778 [Pseudevernia consocians]